MSSDGINQERQAGPLAEYVTRLFRKWKSNREHTLDAKWLRNLGAYNRDPTKSSKWKKADNSESWTSAAMSDVAKQKVVAGHAIISDVYFKGGRLPIMLQDDALPEEVQEAQADDTIPDIPGKAERDQATSSHERYIHRQNNLFVAKHELDKGVRHSAIYGETNFERYIYTTDEKKMVEIAPGVVEMRTEPKRVPAYQHLGVWSVYRDLDVEDPKKGHGVMVVDRASPHDLMELIEEPFYIEKTIRRVIETNKSKTPDKDSNEPRREELSHVTKNIRRIRYWGLVPKRLAAEFADGEDLEVQDLVYDADSDEDTDLVECHLVIAGNEVIRFVETDRDDRPIERLVWEDAVDSVGAVGVCDNLEDINHTLNGLHRNIEDNAKVVTSLILAIRRAMFDSDISELSKRVNILELSPDAKSAQDAFQQIKIDAVLSEMKEMIEMYLSLAEQSSFIPRIQQGQQVGNSDTAFELSERIEKSGKYLGVVISHIDELVERLTTWQYQYNMLDDSVPGENKGVWRVKALGFTSFSNRVIRLQKLLQFLGIVLNSDEAKSLAKVRYLLEEIAKAMDLDPNQVLKSPQELMEEAEQEEQNLLAAQEQGLPIDKIQYDKITAEIEQKRATANYLNAQADEKRRGTTLKEAEAVHRMQQDARQELVVA